jgi:hypothetical protein
MPRVSTDIKHAIPSKHIEMALILSVISRSFLHNQDMDNGLGATSI